MLFGPTSGVIVTLLMKLKYTGNGMNSNSGMRLCGVTSGTCRTRMKVFSSGLKTYEVSMRERSDGLWMNESMSLLAATSLT